jgi:ABC-type multidrug transport system ATPase subunit
VGLTDFMEGEDRKRRGAEPVDQILRTVLAEQDLIDKLALVAKEFIPNIETIRRVVRTERDPELEVVERGGGELRLEELSAGTRQLLLLAAVWLRPRPPTLVLLEEPDAGVHPGGHTALRDLLRSIAKRSVVVLTTHSPAFVGLLDPEIEVMALERSAEGTQLRSLAAAMRQSGWLKAFGAGAEAFVRSASEKGAMSARWTIVTDGEAVSAALARWLARQGGRRSSRRAGLRRGHGPRRSKSAPSLARD